MTDRDTVTRKELVERLVAAAEPLYGVREAGAIARLVAQELCGLSRADIAMYPQQRVEWGEDMERAAEEISASRPVQYVVGQAWFCGLKFVVREGVLIPRPETEELVEWGVSAAEPHATVLDIGTGSGAIAIAIAKRLPEARVTAVDISEDALRLATENAQLNGVDVRFVQADALAKWQGDWAEQEYDVVVSNPPYIPMDDMQRMHSNVTEYEPHLALFVDDSSPLVFYDAIARNALRVLRSGGRLYFEIYEKASEVLVEMLSAMGYVEIELRRDINGKERMLGCRKK